MQEKKIHNGCLVQTAMLNSYHRDRIFNTQLTAIKNSYNKENNVRTFVTQNMRYCLSILMLHTKM